MIEIEVNRKNLSEFLKNIRKEDEVELKSVLGEDYKNKFIEITLNKDYETYFLADKNANPVAIGGVAPFFEFDRKSGQVWLLCANDVKKHKIFLFKYIKNKVENFKKKFNILFNFIYKTNFDALLWLSLLGFEFVDLKNNDFKFFYYKKEGEDFDIRRFAG